MKIYLDLLEKVLLEGEEREDRTGIGTYSLFGEQLIIPNLYNFPLLTTKKMFWKGIVYELLWFLKGENNIKYLTDNGVHIWDEWADENGNVGNIYGVQWRNWNGIDQIKKVIKSIKENPYSRRHIVNTWNVIDIPYMSLPPCHILFQFYVSRFKFLDCHMYQRSADIFLGLPFNIASYALLTRIVSHVTGLSSRKLIISLGDVHLYKNHIPQAIEQLRREPASLPTSISINREKKNIDDIVYDDISLDSYTSAPPIKAEIAV